MDGAGGNGGQQHDNALDDDGEYMSDVMGHYATPGKIFRSSTRERRSNDVHARNEPDTFWVFLTHSYLLGTSSHVKCLRLIRSMMLQMSPIPKISFATRLTEEKTRGNCCYVRILAPLNRS